MGGDRSKPQASGVAELDSRRVSEWKDARDAGEMLCELPKNQGAIPGKTGSKARPVLDNTPTLADLGVSKSTKNGVSCFMLFVLG
jgi:hypothetical protein